MKQFSHILLTALAALLLMAFAAATPWPSITDEAQESHMNESVAVDDEYAFLFE